MSKRLLRVRTVLGSWLKAESLHKPQQLLPEADDELVAKLTDYIIALSTKLQSVERAVAAKEERTAELDTQTSAAAAELKRLVAKRSSQTRKSGAAGLLTEGGHEGGPSRADGAKGAASGASHADAPGPRLGE